MKSVKFWTQHFDADRFTTCLVLSTVTELNRTLYWIEKKKTEKFGICHLYT